MVHGKSFSGHLQIPSYSFLRLILACFLPDARCNLQLGLRECRIYGSFHAYKSVYTDHENVIYNTFFQLIQHAQPVLCALIFADIYRKKLFVTCQADSKYHIRCKYLLAFDEIFGTADYNGIKKLNVLDWLLK